jgi:hypothetical protein
MFQWDELVCLPFFLCEGGVVAANRIKVKLRKYEEKLVFDED